jgi:hypothetical protein
MYCVSLHPSKWNSAGTYEPLPSSLPSLSAAAYKPSPLRHRHSDEPRQLSDPRHALTGFNKHVQAAVDPHEVQTYIGWHRRVTGRALALLAPAAAARDIAAFFHKKVAHLPPVCLLEQVVLHCLAGVKAASRRTVAGLKLLLQVRRVAGGFTALGAAGLTGRR